MFGSSLTQFFGGLADGSHRAVHTEEQLQQQLDRSHRARHNAEKDRNRPLDEVPIYLEHVAVGFATRLLWQKTHCDGRQGFVSQPVEKLAGNPVFIR